MICFDLRCASHHVFEAWFDSSEDYEKQKQMGLVSCPLCDDTAIEKAVMAPALSRNLGRESGQMTGGQERAPPVAEGNVGDNMSDTRQGGGDLSALSPPQIKEILHHLAQAQRRIEQTSDNVGKDFANVARAIHYGDAPERAIMGEASPAEARDLVDEGVPILPLPFRPRDRADA